MTRVIFIRHGQTLWNIEKREMGQLDSPLSEKGVMQAKAIAKRLANITFSTLYSSDLGRALQTAQFTSDITGKDIVTDIELRERNMGIFQGYTRKEMAERYPNEWSEYNSSKKFDYVIPNGESQRQRYERSIRVFNRLANKHPNDEIVIVSHGGILRGIFEYVLCLAPGDEGRFKRRNATYNVFCKENAQWSLEVWGDTSHLSNECL
jgi:broad specificity phosphatase PhoE